MRGNSISVIDPATRKVRTVVEGCPGASDVVILPDSSKAFAACSGGHQVMAILLAPEHTPDASTTTPDRLESLLDVGRGPVHLALKPDGGEVFVSNSLSNSISEVYASTDEVGGAYLMGADPVRGLVSRRQCPALRRQPPLPGGDRLLQSKTASESTPFTSATVHPRWRSPPPAILLFVVDARSGDVAVVRTDSRSLFTMLPAGRGPNAIAVKAFKLP